MAPANSRFGGQNLGASYNRLPPITLSTNTPAHHTSNSGSLPPPSFHHAFGQPNPFASTGNLNGLAGGFGPGGGLGAGGTGLASREAMMRFQHGAELQQQQQMKDQMQREGGMGPKSQMKSRIRDVWRGNFAQEMEVLRDMVESYRYISMDTEFPGIVARPMGAFTTRADYHYQTLRCNVDLLKVIQLGITLFNEDGESPPAHHTEGSSLSSYSSNSIPCPCTWQFNFQFSMSEDMYNQDSIDFLMTAGLDLDAHEKNGIDPHDFGAALTTSGLVNDENVRWISFHSGYDFGYLVKLMLWKPLPEDETEYRKFLGTFFPAIYDIKYMIKTAQRTQAVNDATLSPSATNILNGLGQKSGLQDLADELGIKRIGVAHQAGSDSLLTGKVFWEVKKTIFGGTIDDEKYLGHVWGLNGISSSVSTATYGSNNMDGQSNTPNLNGATIYNPTPTPLQQPSTPANSHSGLATAMASPPHQQSSNNSGGIGSLTPGGGAGVFGSFRGFGGKS